MTRSARGLSATAELLVDIRTETVYYTLAVNHVLMQCILSDDLWSDPCNLFLPYQR